MHHKRHKPRARTHDWDSKVREKEVLVDGENDPPRAKRDKPYLIEGFYPLGTRCDSTPRWVPISRHTTKQKRDDALRVLKSRLKPGDDVEEYRTVDEV